jgi:hypothetical protein
LKAFSLINKICPLNPAKGGVFTMVDLLTKNLKQWNRFGMNYAKTPVKSPLPNHLDKILNKAGNKNNPVHMSGAELKEIQNTINN